MPASGKAARHRVRNLGVERYEMSQLLSRPLAWLLVAILILPGLISPIAQLPDSSPPPASQANAETPLWNVWGADQYALRRRRRVDLDGGAVGGVVQWDKQTGTYRRYTRLDGLPHTEVLAPPSTRPATGGLAETAP